MFESLRRESLRLTGATPRAEIRGYCENKAVNKMK